MEGNSNLGQGRKTGILQYPLSILLKTSLLSSPIVTVSEDDPVKEAVNLLPHNLETFTDSLVVVRGEVPVGLIGGSEILETLLERPRENFFGKRRIGEIMRRNLVILNPETTLGEVIDTWLHTGRAFAILPNKYHGYSAISARRLLEVGMTCKTSMKIGEVSRGGILTFTKSQKVREIIKSMLENKTRKLVLSGTSEFISDRIIIQRISRDLNCLDGVDDFLETDGGQFKLDTAMRASETDSLEKGCRLLYGMESPYLLLPRGVVTPWDVVMGLRSENLVC